MTHEEYEERRRALEEQHRTDVALLNTAQELRLRSLERIWREGIEEERNDDAPDAFAAAAQPATNVREPAPAPTVPATKPIRERYSVVNDLEAALPELPEVFDRRDIIRALGYVPARTTLLRALGMLQNEGLVDVEDPSPGGITTRYRKLGSSG